MRHAALMLVLALGAGGCATKQVRPRAVVTVEPLPNETKWRTIANAEDQARIDALGGQFTRALAAVPRRYRAQITAEGALLDPAAAQAVPMLPPGPYLCRLVRLGGRMPVQTWKPDFCYVDGDEKQLALTKQNGSNLPGGWLFEDQPNRLIFLGTLRSNHAAIAAPYGPDKQANVAAVIERVAPFRWRMVLAQAGKGAALDVYELIPVTPTTTVIAPAAAPRLK